MLTPTYLQLADSIDQLICRALLDAHSNNILNVHRHKWSVMHIK